MTILNLKVGSSEIPRFSCAAHKLNIVVQKAIINTPHVNQTLQTLSSFASNIKKSTHLKNRHRENGCSIHRQNFTRWNSTFLMLLCFWRSYKRNVFNETHTCPVDQEEIEKYIQILCPIFIWSKNLQLDFGNISQVIPSLLAVIHSNLSRLILTTPEQNQFRRLLIKYLCEKFNDELNSKIYLTAAILDVQFLFDWCDRSFGRKYFKQGKVL